MMDAPFTLTFEDFWRWLSAHPNCIIRAGTPESVLYDVEDLHWHFASEAEGTLLVQVLRGKLLLGELLLRPERVTYVQGVAGEDEKEHVFELISETKTDRIAVYFFVLAHGYEEEDLSFTPARVH